jgi:chromosome segregation ATPase
MNAGYPILGGAAIPGDAEGLDKIARRLRAAQADVTQVQRRVAANGLSEWTGEAANRFRSSLTRLPGELGLAAGAFHEAASSLRRFASELSNLQARAADYAARIAEHEEAADAAQRRHDEAQSNVDEARQQQSEATDPAGVKAAADALAVGLSLWRQALAELEEHRGEVSALRRQAHENREQYERAVRLCCVTLEESREAVAAVAIPG